MVKNVVQVNEKGYRVGESHQNNKYSDEFIARVRRLHEDNGLSYREICRRFGLSLSTVAGICRYERRACLSFPKVVD